MIDLVQFINESIAKDKYGVLLDHIELNRIPSVEKLAQLIKEGITQANSRYKVLRIKAIEELNNKTTEWNAEKLKKALAAQEKQVIAYMQTKPGIMKRSEEKRQKYIDDKLEKFKSEWKGVALQAVEYDENNLRFAWHHDVHHDNGYSQLDYDIDTVAKKVAQEIDRQKKDSTWSHLTAIDISVDNDTLTLNKFWSPVFHIIPTFDEETEHTLSAEARKFQDFMSAQYNSGRYMGD